MGMIAGSDARNPVLVGSLGAANVVPNKAVSAVLAGLDCRPLHLGVKGTALQSVGGTSALAWALAPLSGASAVSRRTVRPNRMVVPGARRRARWPRILLAPSMVPLVLRRSSIHHPSPSNQSRACRLETLVSGQRSTSRDEGFFPERPTRTGRPGGKN